MRRMQNQFLYLQQMIKLTPPQSDGSLQWTPYEWQFLEKHKEAKYSEVFELYKSTEIKVTQPIIHQLFARQQVKEKLPFLYENPEVIYPVTLSLEQSSSEATARYKASLFQGDLFVDLSGGMGIDSYFFSMKFKQGIVVERNRELAILTSHNFEKLGRNNLQFAIGTDAGEFLNGYDGRADMVYIDPARRDQQGGKVVRFRDCEPDVSSLLDTMFRLSDIILIKASPLMDMQAAIQELKQVRSIHIVAVNNECKELLFHLDNTFTGDYTIHAVNLELGQETVFSFSPKNESGIEVPVGEILRYVYEPNAAILKAGAFKSVASAFELVKLHRHSHLYTSDMLLPDFPGRSFEVLHKIKVDKQQLHRLLPENKANVSIRNFPGSVQELRKKMGLADGGDFYVFGTTDYTNSKVLLITRKATKFNT